MSFKKGDKINLGRKQTKEHRLNIDKSRREPRSVIKCVICNIEVKRYDHRQVTCGRKECTSSNNKRKYHELKTIDPILSLTKRITGNIRLKDRGKIIKKKLEDALDKPCGYCGEIINLDNASLDHKIPRKFSKLYDRRTGKREYSDSLLRELDGEDNLHIVCKKCNQLKSDMDDGQFRKFLRWLMDNPDIEILIRKRLGYAKVFWKRFS